VKLIIQIPCYNEEDSLPESLKYLPRQVSGFDSVEWLIVDDGSEDGTVEVAKTAGVNHIVSLASNGGLAKGFSIGLEECLRLGADVIVNTDADNQYNADDIPLLVGPILRGEADMVIGERPISGIKHFSPFKKLLQKWGSAVVRSMSRTDVRDAPSGFRAFSRNAAMRLNVFSQYTYTLETIIQAGQEGMVVKSVPIRVNGETRPSRLVKSIGSYVKRSVVTMFRVFVIYRPMRFFGFLAILAFIPGFLLGVRFLVYYLMGEGNGHIQSVILSALLMGSGLLLAIVAVITDLISVNRRLLEKVQWQVRKLEDEIARRKP
jgi:glycosyltransferase involved in cell wall biosynthesis